MEPRTNLEGLENKINPFPCRELKYNSPAVRRLVTIDAILFRQHL